MVDVYRWGMIAPALTSEEWASGTLEEEADDDGVIVFSRQEEEWLGNQGADLGSLVMWDNGVPLPVVLKRAHGLAAVCLHQQPYGFTEEDVEALLQFTDWIAGMEEDAYEAEQCQTLISIADRIAALLPPPERKEGAR